MIDEVLKSMSFEFFGNGMHKIAIAKHIEESNPVFLDVRSNEEYKSVAFDLKYHMPVLHIPIDEIPDRVGEIPREKKVGVFCASGARSTMVYVYLKSKGFENVRIIEGGYAEAFDVLKPGKLLKHISAGNK